VSKLEKLLERMSNPQSKWTWEDLCAYSTQNDHPFQQRDHSFHRNVIGAKRRPVLSDSSNVITRSAAT
jgi:DNA-binding FadR family transcriptional regulator